MASLSSRRPTYGSSSSRKDYQLLFSSYFSRWVHRPCLCSLKRRFGPGDKGAQQRVESTQRAGERNLSRIYRNGNVNRPHLLLFASNFWCTRFLFISVFLEAQSFSGSTCFIVRGISAVISVTSRPLSIPRFTHVHKYLH